MTIPLFTVVPSTSNPLTFAADMDSLLSELNPWTTAVNAAGSAFAAGVSGSSSTSLLIGTGTKSLTVQTGLGFVPGMDVVIAYTTTPTTRMLCTVTSYTSETGALVVSCYSATGSGTYTAWTVSFTSAVDPVQFVTPTGSQTLTNKTINLMSNTLTGTLAQFNAAVSDADLASLAGSETLTNKTLTTPAITFTNNAAVSAAGTTQGTATALTLDYNNVTTVAANAGVVLPISSAGRRITVKNNGANALTVYPASTGTIDALSANAGTSIPVGAVEVFLYTSSVNVQTMDGRQTSLNVANSLVMRDASGNFSAGAITGTSFPSAPLTGTPTTPTAAVGTNTTQVASTAFVYQNVPGRVLFTATGAINSGQVVVLNNDSTVSAVGYSLAAGTLGAEQAFTSVSTQINKVVEVQGTNKCLIFYNGTSVVCATVDPVTSTTSFGTPATTGAWGTNMDACWYPTDSQAVVTYVVSGQLFGVTISLSGTTVTINTPVSAGASSATSGLSPCMAYNTQQNRICVAYYVSAGTVRVMTIAAGVITWQTGASLGGNYVFAIAENPGTSVMLVVQYISGYSYAVAVTINANVCTIGSAVSPGLSISSQTYPSPLVYSQVSGKFVLLLRESGAASRYAVLSVSGTTVTWNTTLSSLPTGYAAANTANCDLTYDGSNGRIILYSQDNSTNKYAQIASCTINGSNQLVASTPVVINVTTSSTLMCTYNSTAQKILVAFQDAGDFSYGHTRVLDSGDSVTNADNWIGVASAAISNGASGYIDVKGGISTAVSGLTPGYTYFIDDTGALQQTGSRCIGRAITATKLLITGAA